MAPPEAYPGPNPGPIADPLPAALDALPAEALADHVELVERRIMERDRAAVRPVADPHAEAEQVAELALERLDVGAVILVAEPRLAFPPRLAEARALLGVAHRQAARDHLLRQRLGVDRRHQRPCVTHCELAGYHQLADALWKIA